MSLDCLSTPPQVTKVGARSTESRRPLVATTTLKTAPPKSCLDAVVAAPAGPPNAQQKARHASNPLEVRVEEVIDLLSDDDKDDGRESTSVRARGADDRGSERGHLPPAQVGRHRMFVEVDVDPGEVISTNGGSGSVVTTAVHAHASTASIPLGIGEAEPLTSRPVTNPGGQLSTKVDGCPVEVLSPNPSDEGDPGCVEGGLHNVVRVPNIACESTETIL